MLAAGKGERLEPLTQGRPKHLLPVAGAPLIAHTLRAIRSAGIDEALLVVHYMKEQIMSTLGDGRSLGISLKYVDQGGILGTGDALRVARAFTEEEPFVLVYGDLAFNPELMSIIASHQKNCASGVIAGIDMEDAREYGAMEFEGDRLLRIMEKPQAAGPATINGGIYLFSPDIFRYVDATPKSERGEFELTTAINLSIGEGAIFKIQHFGHDEWVDVGRPWNLLDANEMLMDTYLKESRIEGQVEADARIIGNVVVEAGSSVLSGAYVEGPSWISSGCRIGPNCYIRPYTYLCRRVKVGNACEMKRSIIMEDSHVGHLSYVGDSILGARCNLGAGTITANLRFDNKPIKVNIKNRRVNSAMRKLGAFIGDDVKTGINVSIFPGVKVGQGSWIGPHVALNRDVPAMSLVTSKTGFIIKTRR